MSGDTFSTVIFIIVMAHILVGMGYLLFKISRAGKKPQADEKDPPENKE
jgi:branched-subunit amino acid ABC-type transport system permease component